MSRDRAANPITQHTLVILEEWHLARYIGSSDFDCVFDAITAVRWEI